MSDVNISGHLPASVQKQKKDFNNSFKKNELSFGSVSPVVKSQKCAKYP